jgi:ferric-dicitrate binding protein FerR (iron transport regulator)
MRNMPASIRPNRRRARRVLLLVVGVVEAAAFEVDADRGEDAAGLTAAGTTRYG